MTDYVAVLSRRYVGKEWSISGDDYETLVWHSDDAKPSKTTLDGLWASVQQEIADEATAKVDARQAILNKLGLTSDEVALLLS